MRAKMMAQNWVLYGDHKTSRFMVWERAVMFVCAGWRGPASIDKPRQVPVGSVGSTGRHTENNIQTKDQPIMQCAEIEINDVMWCCNWASCVCMLNSTRCVFVHESCWWKWRNLGLFAKFVGGSEHLFHQSRWWQFVWTISDWVLV